MNLNTLDTDFYIENSPLSNLARIGNIYIASEMTREGVQFLHDKGVYLFLDFKSQGEVLTNEPALIAAAGGEYVNAPVSSIDCIDQNFLSNINELLDQTDSPVAIYCKSGNRIIAWAILHLCAIQNMDIDEVKNYVSQFPFSRQPTRDFAFELAEQLKTKSASK